MDISITGKQNQSHSFQFFGRTKKANREKSLEAFKGIEVDLFSYSIAPDKFEDEVKNVCGEHFYVHLQSDVSEDYATFYITPKDYCLVDGGMMYTSAGSIISELITRGFLIKGYWTVEK
ncbi:MAG: hypothetical protein NXI10_09025 [bacterium]|nr:hypothetical protein [bacterium]